jgi:hypothetical protein
MSTLSTLRNKLLTSSTQIGRVALNAQFPNEIEAYLLSLELVNSVGKTIQYFSFPVMPSQIQKTEPSRINVKKSASGVTVLSSNAFTPQDITIKGDFGRGLKLLLQPVMEAEEGVAFSGISFGTNSLSASIKTGYGAIKILQNIIQKTTKLDKLGKPFRLYMYNMALGENYLVVPSPAGLSLNQTYDKNTIWQYSITFNILSKLEDLKSYNKKESPTVLLGAVQSGVNSLAGEISQLL